MTQIEEAGAEKARGLRAATTPKACQAKVSYAPFFPRKADTVSVQVGKENWTAGMPTNALLISDPSKTANIDQTLAYGIHGPK